jgi:hypothetical protein
MEGWVEIFSLAWVVPLVLDSMTAVAESVYDYFVGEGILYMLIWGFLAFYIGLYLVKMYFPTHWLQLFGLSGGGQMYDDKTDGWSISKGVLKPLLRAMFAILILLQLKPAYITNYVIEPFLQFGAVYVDSITSIVLPDRIAASAECPEELGGYLSKSGCEFIVGPIDNISRVNNGMIKKGFEFLMPGDGGGLLSIITGLVLIATFFASNLFMALLIIRGIFKFGLSLIVYPFRVLIYVVKDDSDMWVNPWPALSDLIKSLQTLVVSMIAAAFILMVNISVVAAMLSFMPDGAKDFGGHSITWLAAVMTFWIMFRVFKTTRDRLDEYVGDADMTGFYDKVAGNVKSAYKNVKDWGGKAIEILRKTI